MKPKSVTYTAFLVFFFGLGIFLRLKTLNAPFFPALFQFDVVPHLKSSTLDILFSPYHRMINIYRNATTNFLFQQFGVTEFNYRIFSVLISIATMVAVYRLTREHLGLLEAAVSVFLFGGSYFSLFFCMQPLYGGFYMFASILSFYFLFNAVQTGRKLFWICFGFLQFISLTNSIMSIIFVPTLTVVGGFLLYLDFLRDKDFSSQKKSNLLFFSLSLVVSIGLSLVVYAKRGLNILDETYNIMVLRNVSAKIASDDVSHYQIVAPTGKRIVEFFYNVYWKMNFLYFEYRPPTELLNKLSIGYWAYFFFFCLGLFYLYKHNRKLFYCFTLILFLPFLQNLLILKIFNVRPMGCILPFFIITVASGFVYSTQAVLKLIRHLKYQTGITLATAFIIFAWGIHPKPLWSQKYHDEMFQMEGIKAITTYLEKNIQPKDILLNVTNFADLEDYNELTIPIYQYSYYLTPFIENHRLSLIHKREGVVGIWIILKRPLKNHNRLPFYFPNTFIPTLVKKVHGFALYYGKITIPKNMEMRKGHVFNTPFWLFAKAYYFQGKKQVKQAEYYYKLALKDGLNKDRIFYNLCFLFLNQDLKKSLFFIQKAVESIETPYQIEPNQKIYQVNMFNTVDSKGMKISDSKLKRLRFLVLEKNGSRYKKFLIQDFIKSDAKIIFSQYYFLAGLIHYAFYEKTGEESSFLESKKFFLKGLTLYPQTSLKETIEKLINQKSRRFKINLSLVPLNLMGVPDKYPDILND